jgi:putative ABC transport system permease protein
MDAMLGDIRWSLRLIRRRTAHAATVVITLAVAIAGVVTAFELATAVLWKPLPFGDANRLVFVWENTAKTGAPTPSRVTAFRYEAWQQHVGSIDSMALFGSTGFLVDRSTGAAIVRGVRVSTNYFDTLRVTPLLGRTFARSDEEPGHAHVVILSHALWREWFGGSPDAVGAELHLGGRPYTIVGVMPPIVFPAWPVNPATVTLDSDSRRLWVPIARTPALAASARAHVFGVVARLAHGRSVDDAARELTSTAASADTDAHGAIVRPFRQQFVGDARTPLLALFGAALALLLVACTNLTAVQGSTMETRRAELSMRAALGAGRGRLARQFITETALLTGAGGLIGVGLSAFALTRIPALLPPSVPLLMPPALGVNVILFAAVASAAAALGMAAWPLLRTSASALAAPRGTASVARSAVFRGLVIAQVMLAVALVSPAMLLQQSLDSVRGRHAGFAIDRVLVGNVTFVTASVSGDPRRVITAERTLTSDLARLHGVRAVTFAYDHPLEATWIDAFTISGSGERQDDARQSAQLRIVSPNYFDAMDVAVIAGRPFNDRDDLDAPGAVVVNASLAREMASGAALNRIVRSATPRLNWTGAPLPSEFRIVGVVEDERFKGLEEPSAPAIYMSTRQFPQSQLALLVRTEGESSALAPDVRGAIRRVDPLVPVDRLIPLSSILDEQLAARRATTHAIDGFAAAALGLAGLGLYGLLALLVSSRTREIAIRLALGSSPAVEAARVSRECLVSTAAGTIAGVWLALGFGRLVQSLLAGVSPRDPFTLAAVCGTMLLVAAAAAALPAWRAARVDPSTALRG